jgi:hypothetical protein
VLAFGLLRQLLLGFSVEGGLIHEAELCAVLLALLPGIQRVSAG